MMPIVGDSGYGDVHSSHHRKEANHDFRKYDWPMQGFKLTQQVKRQKCHPTEGTFFIKGVERNQ
jgi:hypothetical protein